MDQRIACNEVSRLFIDYHGHHYMTDLLRDTGLQQGQLNHILRNMIENGWIVQGMDYSETVRLHRRYYAITELGKVVLVHSWWDEKRREWPTLLIICIGVLITLYLSIPLILKWWIS